MSKLTDRAALYAGSTSDLDACRALLKGGSKTFFAASKLLPASVRTPAAALYAFCRMADDAIDLTSDKHAALAELRARLDCAYAGQPMPIPADRALAELVACYDIPRALPEALLEGLAWDAEFRTYETIGALHDYAARVAGSVGVMMALLMGTRDRVALARAADLGVAMQLTNIARDVGEDLCAGRLFLPLAWLRDEGIDPTQLMARKRHSPALGRVVARLLAEADRLYLRAASGIAALPLKCRPGIAAARHIYAEIGREVEALGCNSVARRAVVPGRRKLQLLAWSFAHAALPGRTSTAPALVATRYLVEAVGPARRHAGPPDRLAWVLDLFVDLERRDSLARARAWNARQQVAQRSS